MGGLWICIYTVVLFTCANYIIIIYTIFIVKLYSRLPVRLVDLQCVHLVSFQHHLFSLAFTVKQ